APFGDVQLLASRPGGPPSSPERIAVMPGAVAEVLLRLPEAVSAAGKIVGAFSGQPVSSGRIQAWLVADGRWVEPLGDEVATDAAGEFQLGGLAIGSNCFLAVAPGYSRASSTVYIGAESQANIGEL